MPRGAHLRPVAVVDIGSNSVRLVVYEGATRSPAPLFNEKVLCGLGRTIATTGQLSPKGVELALRALRRFRSLCDQMDCERVEVIATAAAREAENGPGFIAEARDAMGAPITVLTGQREAELAALGVAAGLQHVDGFAGDLGGGSLELIDIKDGGLAGGLTLPLGSLRLMDQSGGNLAKAAKIVDAELDKIDTLKDGKGRTFYPVGGTWRALARLHMAQTNYPLRVMHGYRMSTEAALKFAKTLDKLSPGSLAGLQDISSARRETVPYGAIVLERLLARVKPSDVLVSAFGIREGLVYGMLSPTERKKDPLIAACEDIARRRARSTEAAKELVDWTAPIFRATGLEETNEEIRLRHAACLVSDIGWRAHPDYRGAQSLNMLAHATFSGIDHRGRAFLALTAYFRHEGLTKDELSKTLAELVDDRAIKRARVLGAAIRVSHMVSAATPNVLTHTPLEVVGKKIVLTLPGQFAALDGDRLQRRMKTLGKELDIDAEIAFEPERKRAAG